MSAIEAVEIPTEEAVSAPEALPIQEIASSSEDVSTPAASPSLLSVLRVRDFRLVWLGESVSLLGDQFYMIALPWLTLQLTGSGLALGTVAAVGGIPRAVFMLLGGAFTDRFSPRNVMMVSNALRVFLTAFVTLAVLGNFIQVWMLYVASLLFGLVDAFFIPAQSAIIPQLVSREEIQPANAITQITNQLAGFVGPALAGLVIATLSGVTSIDTLNPSVETAQTSGVGLALGFDALTFIIAAVALWLMKGGREAVVNAENTGFKGMMRSIGEGIRLAWKDPLLRTFLLVISAINLLFNGPMGVGLPVLASTRFPEGAAAMGIIFTAFGGGALAGALMAGTLPTPRRTGVWLMILIGISGGLMSLFSVVASLPAAALVGLFMGIGIGYVNVMASGTMQKRVAPEMMGRVMSLMMLASFGMGPISNTIVGFLVDVNLNTMFLGAGVLLVVISALSLTNREVRSLTRS